MGENSKIEWTTHTFNPWVGCTKVSPACDHCYAEGWAKRTGQGALWSGERRRTSEANWRLPLKWNKAQPAGDPYPGFVVKRPRVFCASLADVFDNQVPEIWRSDLFALIEDTPKLDWLLLTKRPQNIRKMIWPKWDAGLPRNIWLGTTVENQTEHDRRRGCLQEIPASVRFLSIEPLLGPMELDLTGIHWVIVGGESGPGARPMHPDWIRSIRDQCTKAGVAFHFKQHGEWIGVPDLRHLPDGVGPGFGAFDHCAYDMNADVVRVGKKASGRLLDGVEHNGFPEIRL